MDVRLEVVAGAASPEQESPADIETMSRHLYTIRGSRASVITDQCRDRRVGVVECIWLFPCHRRTKRVEVWLKMTMDPPV